MVGIVGRWSELRYPLTLLDNKVVPPLTFRENLPLSKKINQNLKKNNKNRKKLSNVGKNGFKQLNTVPKGSFEQFL
jgi:hypothetical protein